MILKFTRWVEKILTRTSSRTHLKSLALPRSWSPWSWPRVLQVLENVLSSAQGQHCFLSGWKKNNQTYKFLEFWHRRSQDFWLGSVNLQITCIMTSSKNFKRRGCLWDKNILESKIRSLGPGLVRRQDVVQDGELERKVNVFKICVKFYCGSAVKKLM